MYNTNFIVKYQTIENELLEKIKNHENKDNENNEEFYSSDDVLNICSKLYQDELLSVFNAENIYDSKIQNAMQSVISILNKNIEFKEIMFIATDFMKSIFIDENSSTNLIKVENIQYLITTFLFSQQLFHITHQCICQQMNTNNIDDELLEELKEKTIELLKEKFMKQNSKSQV
jgi:hypothetical protein